MKAKAYISTCLALFTIVLIFEQCTNQIFPFKAKSAYKQYENTLKQSGLNKAVAGKLWFAESTNAITQPLQIDIPFALSGVFTNNKVQAYGFELAAKQGVVINIKTSWNALDSSQLFIDVFETNSADILASMDAKDSILSFEVEETGAYIIRLQPELLASGFFTLSVSFTNSFTYFPVQGKDAKAVWSVFGDQRDGGKRSHEGIDIFADRGTPVVAPVNGRVTSVRNGGLGGKSVFFRDSKRRHNLYFAHLDSQYVKLGTALNAGDTIGTVGNTGNARNTKPHLHFGIYASFTGAIDPLPFVKNNYAKPATPVTVNKKEIGFNQTSQQANIRKGPSTRFDITETLTPRTLFFVGGAADDWRLIVLPNNRSAFIHQSLVEEITSDSISLQKDAWYFPNPFKYPTDSVQIASTSALVIGQFNKYEMLKTNGLHVWRKQKKS